jgi:hypothetical protein
MSKIIILLVRMLTRATALSTAIPWIDYPRLQGWLCLSDSLRLKSELSQDVSLFESARGRQL